MSDLQIRIATLHDLPILYAFEQGIVQAERPYNPTLKPDKIHYYDLAAYVASEKVEVLVATIDEKIVGSAYGKIKTSKAHEQHDQHAYLGFMYVKPEYRGQGINRSLINALIHWARRLNLKELRLDVYSENIAAIRAYEKAGFCPLLTEMRLELE